MVHYVCYGTCVCVCVCVCVCSGVVCDLPRLEEKLKKNLANLLLEQMHASMLGVARQKGVETYS